MLEPILLPKLQIYFAEFPYNLSEYIYVLASNLGYLLRSRYGCATSFSSYQAKETYLKPITYFLLLITIQSMSHLPQMKDTGKKIAMLFYSFSTLNSHHLSLLIVTQYLNIKIFLFLLPIHFYIHKKPSSHIYINHFLVTTTKICSYHSSTFIHINPSTE